MRTYCTVSKADAGPFDTVTFNFIQTVSDRLAYEINFSLPPTGPTTRKNARFSVNGRTDDGGRMNDDMYGGGEKKINNERRIVQTKTGGGGGGGRAWKNKNRMPPFGPNGYGQVHTRKRGITKAAMTERERKLRNNNINKKKNSYIIIRAAAAETEGLRFLYSSAVHDFPFPRRSSLSTPSPITPSSLAPSHHTHTHTHCLPLFIPVYLLRRAHLVPIIRNLSRVQTSLYLTLYTSSSFSHRSPSPKPSFTFPVRLRT